MYYVWHIGLLETKSDLNSNNSITILQISKKQRIQHLTAHFKSLCITKRFGQIESDVCILYSTEELTQRVTTLYILGGRNLFSSVKLAHSHYKCVSKTARNWMGFKSVYMLSELVLWEWLRLGKHKSFYRMTIDCIKCLVTKITFFCWLYLWPGTVLPALQQTVPVAGLSGLRFGDVSTWTSLHPLTLPLHLAVLHTLNIQAAITWATFSWTFTLSSNMPPVREEKKTVRQWVIAVCFVTVCVCNYAHLTSQSALQGSVTATGWGKCSQRWSDTSRWSLLRTHTTFRLRSPTKKTKNNTKNARFESGNIWQTQLVRISHFFTFNRSDQLSDIQSFIIQP